ncbi:MAG: D-tyrosyl-tRNA(Tyr) deacylase [Lachnospiraceae bacterium]|nr:D-tyrosyl-tRNA(Tyr) deacylase [Lachnospiraceae bacterium]
MKFVIQRVTNAACEVDGKVTGNINKGFLVLIGIAANDTKEIADKMIKKLIGMRIFEDENGKTNLDLKTVGGNLLLISQFTLYADCKHGNRPGFTDAAKPDLAIPLYEYICDECRKNFPNLGTGVFGADMKISLLNDGPFTIVLDSKEIM